MKFEILFEGIKNQQIITVEYYRFGFRFHLLNGEKIHASYPQGWDTRIVKNLEQLEKVLGKNLFEIEFIFEYIDTPLLYRQTTYLVVNGVKESLPIYVIEWSEKAMQDWCCQFNDTAFRGGGLEFDWERTPEYYENEKKKYNKVEKAWYKKLFRF